LAVVLAVLAVQLAVVWWPGCRQYPLLSNRDGIQLNQLVYSACSARDPVRLKLAEKRIDESAKAGNLTPEQEQAFRDILALARAGDWDRAAKASYRMAEDQVR
jgi:hypothetical protein